MFGYNGFGWLTGDEVGSVGWQNQSTWSKLIGSELGGQASWLLWAALIGLAAGLVLTARRPRTDRVRALLIVWGGWLLVTGLTFTLMQGINHAYYAVALAPAIATLVGIGADLLWKRRDNMVALGVIAGTVVVSGFWAKILLDRVPSAAGALATLLPSGSIVAAVGVVLAAAVSGPVAGIAKWTAGVVAAVVLLAGPTAYTIDTVSVGHTGAGGSATDRRPDTARAAGGTSHRWASLN